MRTSEICGLKLAHLDIKNRQVEMNRFAGERTVLSVNQRPSGVPSSGRFGETEPFKYSASSAA